MEEPEPEDLVLNKITQIYRETLKMHKIQHAELLSSLKSLKTELESTTSK